jgi:hypothetical protein
MLAIVAAGCKEKQHLQEQEFDSIKSFLSGFLDNPNLPKDDKERIITTLSKCENNTLELEPVLLQAYMMRAEGYERPDMILTIVDQNEDVIGIGIREDCHDSNCCWNTIEESYPVYIYCLPFDRATTGVIPLHIRTNCQQKDGKAWDEYVNLDYNKLCKEYLQQQVKPPEFFSIRSSLEDFWERTLPPVWVSMPDPNKMDVWVWVFSKSGNKSEPIKLINLVDHQNAEKPTPKN